MAPSTLAATMAVVGAAAGLHPVISPPSLSKMKRAGPDPFGPVTTNEFVPLKTWPVGAPPGMVTVRPTLVTGAPLRPPAYRVAVLVPVVATHSGRVGESA